MHNFYERLNDPNGIVSKEEVIEEIKRLQREISLYIPAAEVTGDMPVFKWVGDDGIDPKAE